MKSNLVRRPEVNSKLFNLINCRPTECVELRIGKVKSKKKLLWVHTLMLCRDVSYCATKSYIEKVVWIHVTVYIGNLANSCRCFDYSYMSVMWPDMVIRRDWIQLIANFRIHLLIYSRKREKESRTLFIEVKPVNPSKLIGHFIIVGASGS